MRMLTNSPRECCHSILRLDIDCRPQEHRAFTRKDSNHSQSRWCCKFLISGGFQEVYTPLCIFYDYDLLRM